MPDIILFDDPVLRQQLLPFTYTRPVAAIRCGIMTIAEKWAVWLNRDISFKTEGYLSQKFRAKQSADNLYINGSLCPDQEAIKAISDLDVNTALLSGQDEVLALRSDKTWEPGEVTTAKTIRYNGQPALIRNVWDIFTFNGAQIRADFKKITYSRQSAGINDRFTAYYNEDQIFIEEGVTIKAAVLNAENGPIYIGRNALIQEGSMIQGPFAIGEQSVTAQGAKIRPNTTVGPQCKVGGEVSNSVIFGFSNKGHDGYLGNSVLGEWCNLGADTNSSNLKNDHGIVKLHSYATNALMPTGLTNCGLMMGDYSKAGISTMFNTGTVVGVNVNVFGGGLQAKHIPSFSWGGTQDGFTEYRIDKALHVSADTVSRRGLAFGQEDENILRTVFEDTKRQRSAFAHL